MDEHKNALPQKPKRPYQKPVLQRVKLVPDEAVLAGCKATWAATGLNTPMSDYCNMPFNCSTIGS